MKVAVSASGDGLDAPVNPRFGRCPYYVVVDTETMKFESVPNTSMNAPSGAGIGAAQIISRKGVEMVLTGSVGPNATQVLSQAGIKIFTGAQGSVRQAIDAFKSGKLKEAPLVGYGGRGFFGGSGGRGMGMGRGIGMGRGMGMGMGGGRGMYTYPNQSPPVQPPSPTVGEHEKEALKRQLEQLERQLKEVKNRLEELER